METESISDRLSKVEFLISTHEHRIGEIGTEMKNLWNEIACVIKWISEKIEPGLKTPIGNNNVSHPKEVNSILLAEEVPSSLSLSPVKRYKSSINEVKNSCTDKNLVLDKIHIPVIVPVVSNDKITPPLCAASIESSFGTSEIPANALTKISPTGISHNIPSFEAFIKSTRCGGVKMNRKDGSFPANHARVHNSTVCDVNEKISNKNKSESEKQDLSGPEDQTDKIHETCMATTGDQLEMRKGKTPMICDECGKVLKSASSLRCHKQIHSNTRPHECKDCGKAFKLKHHLDFHRLTHEGAKKWICRFCEKGFIARRDLMRHERTHTGEKPFPCSYPNCTKSFNVKQHLILHIRTHTGERPYRCSTCNKTFTQANSLRIHRKIHAKDNSNKLSAS